MESVDSIIDVSIGLRPYNMLLVNGIYINSFKDSTPPRYKLPNVGYPILASVNLPSFSG